MCNYGWAPTLAPDAMIENVRNALQSVDARTARLFLGPSGSLLDPREVPPVALASICELADQAPGRELITETRPETVSSGTLDVVLSSTRRKKLSIGMGLESSDPWIQRFCVNKMSHPARYVIAADVLRERGVGVHMNVCLGTAFLSPHEAISDAEASVRWALGNGADLAIVFPLHVRPHTLLAHLWEKGRFEPPSLWALVEVLDRLGPAFQGRVQISWHRDYSSGTSTTASPTTCPLCVDEVLDLLDRFRETGDFRHVRTLKELRCTCKVEWQNEVESSPTAPLRERVLAEYRELAESLDLGWRHISPDLERELARASSH